MVKASRIFAFFSLCFLMGFSHAATAGEPRLLGSYGDWDAYLFIENDNKVCYMTSTPEKSEGTYNKRGDVFALITHRPAEGTKDVFSYISGYTYKAGSEVTVTIDSKKFALFTQDDTAWAPDTTQDQKLAQAIQAGTKMIVTGTSSRDTDTSDSFSLKGATGAYKRITDECND